MEHTAHVGAGRWWECGACGATGPLSTARASGPAEPPLLWLEPPSPSWLAMGVGRGTLQRLCRLEPRRAAGRRRRTAARALCVGHGHRASTTAGRSGAGTNGPCKCQLTGAPSRAPPQCCPPPSVHTRLVTLAGAGRAPWAHLRAVPGPAKCGAGKVRRRRRPGETRLQPPTSTHQKHAHMHVQAIEIVKARSVKPPARTGAAPTSRRARAAPGVRRCRRARAVFPLVSISASMLVTAEQP